MKSKRHLAIALLTSLGVSLFLANAQAQTNPVEGKKHGHGSEMSQLMTPEERTSMRTKMKAAQTPEERKEIRTAMRAEMQKRAKEKGITLPDHKGGHQHQHQHQQQHQHQHDAPAS